MNKSKPGRIASIDVYRALTMLLMIWVNDFWTLDNIPKWLEHAKAGEDYLGFSDLIFPWFLFIVGMSIPFAINNRIRKGESKSRILWHVLTRSFALLVMGIFLVNTETYHAAASNMTKPLFVILMVTGFFLIWNVYPKTKEKKMYIFYGLQVAGALLLIYTAIIYRGTTYEDEHAIVIMQTRWWGILGLIGWTYLVAAPVYLIFRHVRFSMWVFWLLFIAINIVGSSGISYNLFSWQDDHWIVGDGAFHVFAFGGIVTSELLQYFRNKKTVHFYLSLLVLGIVSLMAGFFSRQVFIISKISATPPWVFFSLSSAFALFILLHWIVDAQGKENWFAAIKTAGTATLTCYLIPYYFYSFRSLAGIKLPDFLTTGFIGLIKSMAYAFIIIGIVWLLGKVHVRLKI